MYRLIFATVLRRLDAEAVHHATTRLLVMACSVPGVLAAVRKIIGRPHRALATTAFGVAFPSPIGMAAGFDKDARVHRALDALGFGFVEVGTITAQAQPGNPRPRLFRLPADRALVNRMGFNNAGAAAAAHRLAGDRGRRGVIGVNIGKTKVVPPEGAAADYVTSTGLLAGHADYLVANVSSPNTPGLRDLQAVESLRPLLGAVLDAAPPDLPVLVKIAPDLADEDIDAVADLAVELGLAGIIATNTTTSREGLATPPPLREEAGGLSGAPLGGRSLAVLRRLHERVGGRLVIVSVGGIETAEDAWERITAGASLVQAYTGVVYGGPLWARRVTRQLATRVIAEGFDSVEQAVGSSA